MTTLSETVATINTNTVPAPQYSLSELLDDMGAMQRRVSERLSGIYGDDVILRTILAAVVSSLIAGQRQVEEYKRDNGIE